MSFTLKLMAMVLLGLPRTWNLMGLVNKATLVAQPSKDLHAVPVRTVTPSVFHPNKKAMHAGVKLF